MSDSTLSPRTRAPRRGRGLPVVLGFAALLALTVVVQRGDAEEPGASAPVAAEPESAGPGFRTGSEANQVELLRRLLGVEAPVPEPVAEPEPAPEPEPVAAPEPPPPAEEPAVEAPAAKPARTAPDAKPASTAPAAKPAKAAPVAKPKPAPKPKPKAPPKPKAAPKPAAPAAEPLQEATATPPTTLPAPQEPEIVLPSLYGRPSLSDDVDPAISDAEAKALLRISETDLPPPGTVLGGDDVERWSHVLTPSMRWSLLRGAKIEVASPKPIVMEPWRIEATEKYHSQVKLAADKKTIQNYVAGIPFPFVTETDPDAAEKIIFNYENRIIIDDLEGRNFGCETGRIDLNNGLEVERAGRFGALRRLHYTGRLRLDPKPLWRTPENIRYRESLYPVIEPFNNKGAGFSYARYQDAGRQDDAWMYLPATRRVRRLSTAQRSEGIFGVDVDLDSYGGFAGNPAWFEWRLLGKKTLLAPMHASQEPVRWCDKPAEFMFCDTWEPREMYILSARSLIPGYNFSLRIIYVDAQSNLIPYTEVYDHDGQLWRAYMQQFKSGVDRPMKYATKSVYPVPAIFISAITVFDMQVEHTSRCQFPAAEFPQEEGWYYWFGDKGGTSEDDFDVKNFLSSGR